MKILFFSLENLNNASGFDRLLLDGIANYPVSSDKITIFTSNYGIKRLDDSYIQNRLLGRATYIKESVFKIGHVPLPTFNFIESLYLAFKNSDVIYYVFGFMFFDILVLAFKLILRKKIIISFHAPLILENHFLHNVYLKTVLRMTLKYYDRIHTVNREDTAYFEGIGFKNKTFYIPNGINMDGLLSISIEDKFIHDRLRFAFAGRFEKQKSIDLLIKVMPRLKNLKIEFYFAGSGSFQNEIIRSSQDFDFVKYLGFLNFDELNRFYSQVDIFVAPSHQEPFGIVIIEALASGLPVIASKTSGPLDLLEEGSTGWFINAINEDAIYDKIIEIYNRWLENKDYFKNMPSLCRETAKKYSVENMLVNMRHKLFS
jgi:glycosyltransferase involved in cell wall biosynthesis